MIRFEQVEKRYTSGQTALSDLNLSVGVGELVFLTGPSGAGKSTVLKLLGLLERPTRGRITVAGVELGQVKASGIPAYRQSIGMVFQDHRLIHELSNWDNIALPLRLAGGLRRELDSRVQAALATVGLEGQDQKRPIAMSAGEQQRVGIARALVTRPDVVIADEPTGNLDPNLSLDILQLFQSIAKSGVTVLIASHDQRLIEQLGARQIRLAGGRAVGSAQD